MNLLYSKTRFRTALCVYCFGKFVKGTRFLEFFHFVFACMES